jgi:hypothetical protein
MGAASHVYSSSPQATGKRRVDRQITGGDVAKEDEIDMNSEEYLKQLIKLSSKGSIEVSDKARALQFFIITGGAEGFLDPSYKNQDANNRLEGGGVTTGGAPGTTMRFSDTDLLTVFDAHGKLISSALLRRPMWIHNPVSGRNVPLPKSTVRGTAPLYPFTTIPTDTGTSTITVCG